MPAYPPVFKPTLHRCSKHLPWSMLRRRSKSLTCLRWRFCSHPWSCRRHYRWAIVPRQASRLRATHRSPVAGAGFFQMQRAACWE